MTGGIRLDWRVLLVVLAFGVGGTPREGFGQIGALVSPGRLSRAHQSLEGITNCLSCHAAGQGVSAAKCLTCHQPVADRIQQKKGVHRNVTTDCVTCHVEHAGVDANLRPFDQARFNHAADAGFPLDGLHQPLSSNCAACHKGRSFLTAKAACASCHQDTHKGSLGTQCSTCHTTAVAFRQTRTTFDHSRTDFALTGAHVKVGCASCHKTPNVYGKVAFASCASCHADPHRQRFAGACSSCHATSAWRTTKVDHSRTAFPLKGLHATATCVSCHVQPASVVKPASQTCSACHRDPHEGSFRQDCAACHDESGFTKGRFDHSTTRFALRDRHAGLVCVSCHAKPASPAPPVAVSRTLARPARGAGATDFRGLRVECASCHTDVHRGELGLACETCHSARTFETPAFRHARQRPFFEGLHLTLRCEQCHPAGATPAPVVRTTVPSLVARAGAPPRMAHAGLTRTSDACVSCHRDVHEGQVGQQCESCHGIEAPKFAIASFDHARTTFPLTGKHAPVMCDACHKVESRSSPSGTTSVRRLTGIGTACSACHTDPHGGQLDQNCQTCHSVETFTITRYTHLRARSLGEFFVGRHASAACSACHKAVAAAPARGARIVAASAPVSYRTSTSCTTCHTDVHRGSLGPRCESCHKP